MEEQVTIITTIEICKNSTMIGHQIGYFKWLRKLIDGNSDGTLRTEKDEESP